MDNKLATQQGTPKGTPKLFTPADVMRILRLTRPTFKYWTGPLGIVRPAQKMARLSLYNLQSILDLALAQVLLGFGLKSSVVSILFDAINKAGGKSIWRSYKLKRGTTVFSFDLRRIALPPNWDRASARGRELVTRLKKLAGPSSISVGDPEKALSGLVLGFYLPKANERTEIVVFSDKEKYGLGANGTILVYLDTIIEQIEFRTGEKL